MSTSIDPAPDHAASDLPTRRPVWRRPAVLLIAGLVALLLVVVLVVFQPQRLLFDVTVDDEFPMVASEPAVPTPAEEAPTDADGATDDPAMDGADEPDPDESGLDTGGTADTDDAAAGAEDAVEEPTGPVALSSGTFTSRNRYTTIGTATVFELPDGSRTLRLEDFETTNGPDLFVYLTVANADDDDPALDAEFVNLGDLRGNIGNQNYDLPADLDLERYDTVVIWCRRFSSSFGVADLAAG